MTESEESAAKRAEIGVAVAVANSAKITSTCGPTLKDLLLYTFTNSSTHLKTKYRPAKIIEIPFLPKVTLPSGFWDAGVHYEPDRGYSSEAQLTQFSLDLIRGVLAGLGSKDVRVVPQVQNMDVTPALTLVFGNDRVNGLAWEDKMDNGGDAIWNSDSEIAGQVFEQLMVTHIGLGGPAYGIYSTFNSVRLVSNVNFDASQVDNVSVPVRAADADASAEKIPDRLLPPCHDESRVTSTQVVPLARKPNKEAEQDNF